MTLHPKVRAALAQKSDKKEKPTGTPVLWRDPGDIAARDLRYGPGSAELAPQAPFTFLEEVKAGESPKFKVRDARGVEWGVKVGPEAQPEMISTRLVWAVGGSHGCLTTRRLAGPPPSRSITHPGRVGRPRCSD